MFDMRNIGCLWVVLCCLNLIQCAKILGVFPSPGYSQFILGESLMLELVKRGHTVTVISPFKPNQEVSNYRSIVTKRKEFGNWLDRPAMNVFLKQIHFINMCTDISESILSDPGVQDLIYSNETFDLLLAEIFGNEAHFALAPHFKSKLIAFSSVGLSDWSSHLIGNIRLPSITAYIFMPLSNTMDFFQRLENTVITFWNNILKMLIYFPKQQKLIDKYFPYHMDLDAVINNVSLVLMNSHTATAETTTLSNAAIEIGGFHVLAKKLPSHIQKFLDGATDGAVFFSMGSNINSTNMPHEKLNSIIRAIAKMKQRVIWKYEEDIPEKLDNLLISTWLPQCDILAHKNIVAFVSHGGLLSMTEAVHFGVPVIGIPIFGDQPLNIAKGIRRGTTILLPYKELDGDSLFRAITEITQNKQYMLKAKHYSNILRDQVAKPMDIAMHWVEHVLKYGGDHLRNPSMDLYWFQIYLLDIMLFSIMCLVIPFYSVKFILKTFYKKMTVHKRKEKEN